MSATENPTGRLDVHEILYMSATEKPLCTRQSLAGRLGMSATEQPIGTSQSLTPLGPLLAAYLWATDQPTYTRHSLAGLVHWKYRSSSNNPWYALEDDDEIKTSADDNSNQSHEFIKYKILCNNFSD